MHRKSFYFFLFLAGFISAGCGSASTVQRTEAPSIEEEKTELAFLLPTDIPDFGNLESPPLPGSKEEEEDFKAILLAQKNRTSDDCKRAISEETVNVATFYGPPYGPLSEKDLEKSKSFFEDLRKESRYFSKKVKATWNRKRPYDANPEVHPCVKLETSTAYPSGHATAAALFGKTLTVLYPKKKNPIEKRREVIAQDRVLAGVHHPTDILAGKKFGTFLFNELMKSQKFNSALQAEKEKLK